MSPARSSAPDQANTKTFARQIMKAMAAYARRARCAGLAGFALILLSASLAQAEFGPRTTIGSNYQQSSNTTSRDALNPDGCEGTSICHVLFQPIPQRKALLLQHVSCLVTVTAGDLSNGVILTRKGQAFLFRRTRLLASTVSTRRWIANGIVMHLFKSGERPVIAFVNSESANFFAECSISGQLQQR